MITTARRTDDAARALAEAGAFLALDPVRNNVVATLLETRARHPEPGDYWIVAHDDGVAGVVFHSPLDYLAALTPMDRDAAVAVAEAMAGAGVTLPGVSGDAPTAAAFAGAWAARTKAPARPVRGQRIFEVERVVAPRAVDGRLRPAARAERDLVIDWVTAFHADIGEAPAGDVAAVVDVRLIAGHFWLWDDGGPVSIAGTTDAVDSVVRIGPVYTPPGRRGHGFASALVAGIATAVLARGERCILYTDLDNPTSNGIYQAIGFAPVDEVIRYRFG